MSEPDYKLQPMVVYIEQRLECDTCGALAIILDLEVVGHDAEGKRILSKEAYCQQCWHNVVHKGEVVE